MCNYILFFISSSKTHSGFYILPVSSLCEPDILLRDSNEAIVAALKVEMLENPTGLLHIIVSSPLLCGMLFQAMFSCCCVVLLNDSRPFDAKFKEAYLYDTIGGNNSQIALNELLQERPELHSNKLYSHRLCSVYRRMDIKLAPISFST